VQAAIKKKLEKQKKRSSGQAGGVGVIQSAQPPRHHKPAQFPQMTAAFEDRESLEEELEDMMEGPQRGEREEEEEEEGEEGEPADLLPIMNSMFGQVGAAVCVCACVCVCV